MSNCTSLEKCGQECCPEKVSVCCGLIFQWCRCYRGQRANISRDLEKVMEKKRYRMKASPEPKSYEVRPQSSHSVSGPVGVLTYSSDSLSGSGPKQSLYENINIQKQMDQSQKNTGGYAQHEEPEDVYIECNTAVEDHIYGNDASNLYYNYEGPTDNKEPHNEEGDDVYIFPDNVLGRN